MNPIIKAQLSNFSKLFSIEERSEDRQFEIYSIFCILSGLLGENCDACDVHLDGNEFGIDGVAILIQGELSKDAETAKEKLDIIKNPDVHFIFFQSKTGTSFEYGEVSKFFDAVKMFFENETTTESSALKELMSAKSEIYNNHQLRKNPSVSCFFVTTGIYDKNTNQAEHLRAKFRKEMSNLNIFEDNIVIEFPGARELQNWYRAATIAAEATIEFPRNVALPSNIHADEAYIGYIDAANLLKLFYHRDEQDVSPSVKKSVFFDNIRDYDPDSLININIKKLTRETGGAEFVFRNNGITVVAKNISRKSDSFRLEDYQIVNGCQTSNIIFDIVYGDAPERTNGDPKYASEISIPFRLIGSKDDEFISSIIIGTNRQNSVGEEQFWALRIFLKNLEEYCRSLSGDEVIFIERRDNQYKNQPIERTRIMQPSLLMKAVAATLLFQPHRAGRDYRGIMREYQDKIFLDIHNVQIYHAVAYLYYRLEFLWRNQRINSNTKIYRFYILATIGLRVTGQKNVFKMKEKQIVNIAKSITEIASDEQKMIEMLHLCNNSIGSVIEKLEISEEKARDTIRNDSFASAFLEVLSKSE